MKRIGVLTNIDANHGSCVFNFALQDMLHRALPGYKVNFVDYLTPTWQLYELLRALKPNFDVPFFNLRRYRHLMRKSREVLDTIKLGSLLMPRSYPHLVRALNALQYDILLVSKVVWDIAKIIQTPDFPNIYWLSEDILAVKVAYAVSAHRTDLDLFNQHRDRVKSILNSYKMIAVRDRFTLNLLNDLNLDTQVQIKKAPDPAFFFMKEKVDRYQICRKYQLEPQQPILGLLFYGQPELSQMCYQHFRQRGFQVINFNMYNRYVDHNLGHLADPYDWAALFQVLDFCVTDRYHGSIFCIRERIPFVAIEPYPPRSLLHSKIYDVLRDFGLIMCYQNPFALGFERQHLMETILHVERVWEGELQPAIHPQLTRDVLVWQEYARQLRTLS